MRTALGVDVGGTKIAAALVELAGGGILHRCDLPTPRGTGAPAIIEAIRRAAATVRERGRGEGLEPEGLGLGLPELVRLDGSIASTWLADWSGHDPRRELADFGAVAVDSDVRLAALAEQRFGHGRDLPSFVFVSVGSGLSYALCADGRIHRGANGFAIHFASMDLVAVTPGGRTDFTLEEFASGLGLSRTYAARTGRTASARDIVEGRAGAEGALLLDQATTALASYVGQMVNMLDPHGIVVGGGLGTAAGFFEGLRAATPPFIWAESCRGLPLLASALGTAAGVVGAAALHAGRSDIGDRAGHHGTE